MHFHTVLILEEKKAFQHFTKTDRVLSSGLVMYAILYVEYVPSRLNLLKVLSLKGFF